MFCVYQRGRGQEPVTVAGSIRSFVAVNTTASFVVAGGLRVGSSHADAQDVVAGRREQGLAVAVETLEITHEELTRA